MARGSGQLRRLSVHEFQAQRFLREVLTPTLVIRRNAEMQS